MSFLDNLENNLKALESRDDSGDLEQRNRQRDAERENALAAAPNAERLKSSPFTEELLRQATFQGHSLRTKVRFVWLGATLRLEARDRRLELQPRPEGVVAVFFEDNAVREQAVDLDGNPEPLVREWLESATDSGTAP